MIHFLLFITVRTYRKFFNYFNNYLGRIYTLGCLKHAHVSFNPKTLVIYGFPQLYIGKEAKVKIADNFICSSNASLSIDNNTVCKIHVNDGAELSIGKNSGMTNSVIQCYEKIEIGDNVNIGASCLIMDTNFHSTNWKDRLDRKQDIRMRKNAPVKIGNLVFIGTRSIICKGVSIGDKSMVAAGSVVVSNIPEGEIWGGNPAKFIKKINAF